MTYTYPAIFHREGEDVWVEFPDLVGCQTYGASEAEAKASAKEALSLFIETLIEDNEHLPVPSSLPISVLDKNSVVSLVECSVNSKPPRSRYRIVQAPRQRVASYN